MASPYDVAIHLSLVSNVAEGLAIIVSRLSSADIGVKKLETGLARLKPAVIGAVAAFAGFETVKGIWKLAEGSKDLLNQQDQLRRAGLSNLDVLRLTAEAYDKMGKAIPTASADEFLKTVRELRAVTGGGKAGLQAAIAQAPKSLMVDALLSNAFGTESHGEYYKLLRSSEMKGIATDPKKREAMVDQAFSYITAFSGKLTADDFQAFARRGGTAWMNMKPEAFGPAAVAMADLKGSAAGTALMTLQQLQQGTMVLSRQQADTMKKAGLLDMSKTHKTGFGGGKLQLDPGAILGSLQYMGDLPGWVKNVVYPHMMGAAGGDEALFQNMLGKEAPNRNAAKMIEMFGNKGFLDQIAKDLGLAERVLPIAEAYERFITANPVGVEAAYEAQKKSMLEAIGSPIMMNVAIPVMRQITEMFESIGIFAKDHPEAIANIARGMSILGAALIAGGGVAILSALGPAGWLAAGIIAAGTAMAIYKNPILAWLESVRTENWNEDITKALTPIATSLKQWFIDLPGKVADAINGMWENMKKNLGGLLHYENYGGGGGGGIIRTSYGGAATSSIGGGGAMGNIPIGSPGSNPILAAIHTAAGGDTRIEQVMRNIYASESGHGSHWDLGDSGAAGGPFQLNTAGGRLGAQFENAFQGMSVHDPKTLQAQANFVAGWLRKNPHVNPSNVWFGLRHPERFGHLTGGYAGGGAISGAPSGGTHLGGLINVGGSAFHFGSGGGSRQHIPYGDYPITPGTIGAWGQAHGAIGINNNAIWDSTLDRMRRGIEMHAGHGDALFTAGCIAIAKGEWPQFKSKVQELTRMGGGATLHVGPGGASIMPTRRGGETIHHTHIHLDGKVIARSTSKHLANHAQYATSVGRQDGHGTFMGPGAEVFA